MKVFSERIPCGLEAGLASELKIKIILYTEDSLQFCPEPLLVQGLLQGASINQFLKKNIKKQESIRREKYYKAQRLQKTIYSVSADFHLKNIYDIYAALSTIFLF
ncbi:MAG: hypothetical protein V3U15_04430 [Nitrospinota bacterium]